MPLTNEVGVGLAVRRFVVLSWLLLLSAGLLAQQAQSAPSFDYDIARQHEIKPHRRTIPVSGMQDGSTQLHITLTVSAAGIVVGARAESQDDAMKFWPRIEPEVGRWRFTPFELDGKPVTAAVEEYVDVVPPQRLPVIHVPPPLLQADSKVRITLQRTGCYGTCPAYIVSISTDGIEFIGRGSVVAVGNHSDRINPERVRTLAKELEATDFFSMRDSYRAGVTDCPTYVLSATIDGHKKEVEDYMGSWVGMPAVISDLEDEIDDVAGTTKWIEGTDGLVASLTAEGFDFHSPDAQSILKLASDRGQTSTVQQLVKAGVSLEQLSPSQLDNWTLSGVTERTGLLTASSGHPATLKVLLDAAASKTDRSDKNMALARAARSGSVEAVRLLIAYGANPNAELDSNSGKPRRSRSADEMNGPGSVLIEAASSGNPDVVREILRYHPDLEARGFRQQTAVFFAGDSRTTDNPVDRVACVRLLVQAGANVNAHDFDGNTPLHEIFLTDVEEELLTLGADVNARNKDGETPIFVNVDDSAVALFIAHGADLSIRDKKGKTVFQAAKTEGPLRQEALRKAVEQLKKQ